MSGRSRIGIPSSRGINPRPNDSPALSPCARSGNGPGEGLVLPVPAYRVEALDEAVDE